MPASSGRLNFQMMYFLYLIFFQTALVTSSPVDSSDPLFGSDALGGFADKVKGWTETAWSNSKVGIENTKTATNPNLEWDQITKQDWTETAWQSTKAGTKCMTEAGGDTAKWKECAETFSSGGNHAVTSDAGHIGKDRVFLLPLLLLIVLMKIQYMGINKDKLRI